MIISVPMDLMVSMGIVMEEGLITGRRVGVTTFPWGVENLQILASPSRCFTSKLVLAMNITR